MADTRIPRIVGNKRAEPYQYRIMERVASAIAQGRTGAVLAPTGSGKSLIGAAALEDAIRLDKPIMILHPDVNLLRQNLGQFNATEAFRTANAAAFVAKNEKFGHELLRDDFSAQVILATNMSLVNKIDDATFLTAARKFGERGGVVLIDEGHKAAAHQLAKILSIISDAGGSGIVLTATPFRADGLDPLDPFDASTEKDLIAAAEFNEVLATGRIVKTVFDIAAGEFERLIGDEAFTLIEDSFLALLGENKSIDQASKMAFSRFFADGASRSDRAIGELIVGALCHIWRKRAAQSRLAMIHCDSIAFATALTRRLASETLPPGHPRASQNPSIGFVVASDTSVYKDGHEIDVTELGWKRADARNSMLDAARAGEFDILVNVNALGVGTDVPQTDLNILACRERSLAPVKQISGRGERSYPDKTHQVFVDIGASLVGIYSDIDAMRRNNPECARRRIRELPADIRRQFEQWFDTDPDLAGKIQRRLDEIAERQREEADHETYIDEDDPTTIDDDPPMLWPIGHAVQGIGRAKRDPITKKFRHQTAVVVDLVEAGYLPAQKSEADPRYLTMIHDDEGAFNQAWLAGKLDSARQFIGFAGIRPKSRRTNDDVYGKFSNPPTPGQVDFLRNIGRKEKAPQFAKPFLHPDDKEQATLSISLRTDYQRPADKPHPTLLLEMLETGFRHLIARSLKRNDIEHPVRAIVLEQPDRIGNQKFALLAAAAKLRAELARLAPGAYERPASLSIVSYDPTMPADAIDAFRKAGARFNLIDNPQLAEQSRPRLVEGLALGRIIAIGPNGSADAWLRGKAGLPRKDEAAQEREKIFRDVLSEHFPDQKLVLTRSERADAAKAFATGKNGAPVGTFAARLVRLVPSDCPLTAAIIPDKEACTLDVPFHLICAGFAMLGAGDQKAVLAAADKLSVFKRNLAQYQAHR